MEPMIVRGKVTNRYNVRMTRMVTNGRAAVDPWPTAIKFRMTKPIEKGTAEEGDIDTS